MEVATDMNPKVESPPGCRFCRAPLRHTLIDLGMSPLCESFLHLHQLNSMEAFYPLHVYVCGECFLVQLEAYVGAAQIFSDYAYFSSYSDSWVEHARQYAEMVTQRFDLGSNNLVVELASNDGYLLQHFVAKGTPCFGVEPAANVAAVAISKGVPTIVEFFGVDMARKLADQGCQADLIIGNNVLAQVPDLNDFVQGIKILLRTTGVVTLEFPHLMRLMAENQFDTIYHEHFSYFSFTTSELVLAAHGLTAFDVDVLPTHGGSLRVYARHTEDSSRPISARVGEMRLRERAAGLLNIAAYESFTEQVIAIKHALLSFMIDVKRRGQSIAGYGAPGKGNTLLNYCGVRTDFLDYTVDRNPHKQGKYLPGTHIPIFAPDTISETKPDYVLILPWNLRREIMGQMAHIRAWGGRFVTPIPSVQID